VRSTRAVDGVEESIPEAGRRLGRKDPSDGGAGAIAGGDGATRRGVRPAADRVIDAEVRVRPRAPDLVLVHYGQLFARWMAAHHRQYVVPPYFWR